MKTMTIGGVLISPAVMLAPMAGYTDSAFRSLCRRFGSGVAFSEVVSADGIVRSSRPTLRLLSTAPGERPLGANLYGANAAAMAGAAAVIEQMGTYDFIDVNCGCPMRKVVAKGSGAALMKSPEKLEQIVRSIVAAVKMPVTVKTRIGYTASQMNVSEVAHAAENGGASAITIHARLAENRHSGDADWNALARIKQELKIPVIGNGGIHKPEDALRMFEQTGVDGVMIGRAAIGNPWIFESIVALLEGRPSREHDLIERKQVILEHIHSLVASLNRDGDMRRRKNHTSEETAVLIFRGHLVKYLNGIRNISEARRKLSTLRRIEDVLELVDYVFAREQERLGEVV